MGHDDDGSSEIDSGGSGYLITAKGVACERVEQAVVRPTTLILNGEALDLIELLQFTDQESTIDKGTRTSLRFSIHLSLVNLPNNSHD